MQIKTPSYLHYGHRFCSGYIDYLKARNNGRTNIFNWYCFFFNLFWLVYHRMYKEAAIFIFILLNIIHLSFHGFIEPPVFFASFTLLYISIGFFSFSIYEKHCDLKFWKNKDKEDIYKFIKPYSFVISFVIFVIFTSSVVIAEAMLINKIFSIF